MLRANPSNIYKACVENILGMIRFESPNREPYGSGIEFYDGGGAVIL